MRVMLQVVEIGLNNTSLVVFESVFFDYKKNSCFSSKYIQINGNKKTYVPFEFNMNISCKPIPLLKISVREIELSGRVSRPIYSFKEVTVFEER